MQNVEHVRVTDEWLYKYVPVVDAAIIRELENRSDVNYEFSNKFKRKMKRLIRKEAHPWLGTFYGISKRVAIFLLCILSVTLAVVMSVEAYRNKFFETIKTFLGDAYELRYESDEDPNQIEEYKEPAYIPQGYQEIERIQNANTLGIVYENDVGNLIVWEQDLIVDGGALVIDSEYDSEVTEIVNGMNVTMYIYNEGYVVAYFEESYYAYYLSAGYLSVEEIKRMIESMSL